MAAYVLLVYMRIGLETSSIQIKSASLGFSARSDKSASPRAKFKVAMPDKTSICICGYCRHFQPDPQGKFEGIIDVFEDGSVFAINVPGHTAGSVAFLVRTTKGPVLLTGDACHTRWSWEHTVEPGDFTADRERNLKNLQALKSLTSRHPQIAVRLGHQP